MGKKRIVKRGGSDFDISLKARALKRLPRKKVSSGKLHIEATYNNTRINFTDQKGDTILWSSAGALGFKGTRKGTPFAASKVAELVAQKLNLLNVKEVDVRIKGVGPGRESALRYFIAQRDLNIKSIKDVTPIPHNGPKPPKPRRV
jgi:small subunit ribosomal protein S11